MLPLRFVRCGTIPLSQFKQCFNPRPSSLGSNSVLYCISNRPTHHIPIVSSCFHTSSHRCQSDTSQNRDDEKEKIALISSQMNLRLVNENSFLSWCRNAYLSSVVGIAMMEEATSSLGQSAGFGAFLIGGMNVFWGTGCHIINLVRLRHAAGMSTGVLTLNILGSLVHCLLYFFILTCYIGFLDDPNYVKGGQKQTENDSGSVNRKEL